MNIFSTGLLAFIFGMAGNIAVSLAIGCASLLCKGNDRNITYRGTLIQQSSLFQLVVLSASIAVAYLIMF